MQSQFFVRSRLRSQIFNFELLNNLLIGSEFPKEIDDEWVFAIYDKPLGFYTIYQGSSK